MLLTAEILTSAHRPGLVVGRLMTRSNRNLCSAIALFGVLGVASVAHAAPRDPDRRLEYRVAWNGIPAASAFVTVTPGGVAGRDSLVVEASARTNAFVSLFWSFDGTVRTTMLAKGLTPLHFDYRRRMNGTPYATTIDFAPGQAHSVHVKGERRREIDLAADDVIDPITAVFRARLSDALPGESLTYDVWTGEVRYHVRLDIQDEERIDVPAGQFSALKVVPELWRLEGEPAPDTRLRHATVWVSDDPEHLLLRIRSRIFVGAVTLDLVKDDPGA
jgi:hypothetical protein